jgi:hypothetical protein
MTQDILITTFMRLLPGEDSVRGSEPGSAGRRISGQSK